MKLTKRSLKSIIKKELMLAKKSITEAPLPIDLKDEFSDDPWGYEAQLLFRPVNFKAHTDLPSVTFDAVVQFGFSEDLWSSAMKAYKYHSKKITKPDVITLVDFRRPGNSKRLWVLNFSRESGEISEVIHCRVSHGRMSYDGAKNLPYRRDPAGARKRANGVPTVFSNTNLSFQSCVGSFITLGAYSSGAGWYGDNRMKPGMRIEGVDKQWNSNTKWPRAIVFHAALYMSESGDNLDTSLGCFATHEKNNQVIIDNISGGSFVYAYAGDKEKPTYGQDETLEWEMMDTVPYDDESQRGK